MIKAMDTLVGNKTNNVQAARIITKVKADASGKVPDVIEMIPSGMWPNSWKGSLEITENDLQEYVDNFNTGVGLPDSGSEGAPVDYSHDDHQKAGGWIKKVYIQAGVLMAQIEWTPAAIQSIKDGEFKFISPSFYPRCLGHWCDPENPERTAVNVLLGAGLTNIPFFKGMKGIKASQYDGGEQGHSLFISASQERNTMTKTLEELRKTPVGEIANLSDEDKAVLSGAKDQLTADEQVAFGLVETPTPAADTPPSPSDVIQNTPADGGTKLTPEAVAVQASINAGTHKLVATNELEGLKASLKVQGETIQKYERERIDASVTKAIAEGKIVASEANDWGDRIEKDPTMQKTLDNLRPNPIVASEIGDANGSAQTATAQIKAEAAKLVASAKESGETLEIGTAMGRVIASNPALGSQYQDEVRLSAEGK
jgi:phage I-like protein